MTIAGLNHDKFFNEMGDKKKQQCHFETDILWNRTHDISVDIH